MLYLAFDGVFVQFAVYAHGDNVLNSNITQKSLIFKEESTIYNVAFT